MPTDTKPELARQVFTTSRELEYFSESELVTQTGYSREEWWPGVLVKELLDNGLDVCEQTGVVPEIVLEFTGDSLTITDNGPGIPAEVVRRILDFSTRTSDKAAYVSPTRGAQGNALKTVLAIPYVLNGGQPSAVTIEAQGLRHLITVATDQIARRPQIDHEIEEIVKSAGTSIRVELNSASSEVTDEGCNSLQKLLLDYSLFNPHATLALKECGDVYRFGGTATDWTKWRPSDPTSAHWYTAERLENLIASYVAAERTGGRERTVREFVSEFRGLSATAKQKQVTAEADLDRAYLHDLIAGGRIDRAAMVRLVAVMQRLSAPVKPEALGVLGEQHFRDRIGKGAASFRYKRFTGIDAEGLPFVVECAFALTDDLSLQGKHIGMNWSVPLTNPVKENTFSAADGETVWGLGGLLESNRIELEDDPICLVLHLICPRFSFLDRGKGSVHLPRSFAQAVAKAILDTTKEWANIKKKEERDRRQAERLKERMARGREERVSVKDAAYAVMAEAYQKASGNGHYPANARQIMYAARPAIQDLTGESLKDTYFTQTLLPDYIRDHPEETAGWDVVYDARGHLFEPHTGVEISLGTIGVREYLSSMGETELSGVKLHIPIWSSAYPTRGHRNRYGAILYIEKEGFLPLLQQAGIAERYDLAIMSSKGMGTTSSRTLIERLSQPVMILVVHDFDKSGFSIAGTLTRDTRRYTFAVAPRVIDIGLRLGDVEEWGLESEEVIHKSDPTENLILNGSTAKEIDFLCGDYLYAQNCYKGRRVELNAFTSDQFVEWLESKLKEHGVTKVIPDTATLEQAYRRAAGLKRCQAILERAVAEIGAYADNVEVPEDLAERVREQLAHAPGQAWDDAIEWLVPPANLDE
jgi:DNA topoisomerase VI subunit B